MEISRILWKVPHLGGLGAGSSTCQEGCCGEKQKASKWLPLTLLPTLLTFKVVIDIIGLMFTVLVTFLFIGFVVCFSPTFSFPPSLVLIEHFI